MADEGGVAELLGFAVPPDPSGGRWWTQFCLPYPDILFPVFVALAVGVFGIGEILRNLEHGGGDRTVLGTALGGLWPSRADLKAMVAPMIRAMPPSVVPGTAS